LRAFFAPFLAPFFAPPFLALLRPFFAAMVKSPVMEVLALSRIPGDSVRR
jgi:hypothetical protein